MEIAVAFSYGQVNVTSPSLPMSHLRSKLHVACVSTHAQVGIDAHADGSNAQLPFP